MGIPAAEAITERTIRYYRSLGMLDAPVGGYVKSFTEKHRLQLLAIRLYQAQGLPLRLIRDRVLGQSEKAIRDLVSNESLKRELPEVDLFAGASGAQQWSVAPLGDDFLIISRRGRCLRPQLLAKLQEVIDADNPDVSTPPHPIP